MDEVWTMIDKRSLFKLSWGLRGKAGSESKADHEQLLTEWKIRIIREKLFLAKMLNLTFLALQNLSIYV